MPDPGYLTAAYRAAQESRAAGDLFRAQSILDRALDTGRAELGEDHPDVLAVAQLLARLHREAGDPAGARRVLEEALAAGERRFGPADPLLLTMAYDLGMVAEELGNRHEARRNLARIAQAGPILGVDHPAVRAAQAYLTDAGRHGSASAGPPTATDSLTASAGPGTATPPVPPTRPNTPTTPPASPTHPHTTLQQAPPTGRTSATTQAPLPTHRTVPPSSLFTRPTAATSPPSPQTRPDAAPLIRPNPTTTSPATTIQPAPSPGATGPATAGQPGPSPPDQGRRTGDVRFAARRPWVTAIVAAVAGLVVAALATVPALRGKGTGRDAGDAPPPTTAAALTGAPPTGVRVVRNGSEVAVTWQDPASGRAMFVIFGAPPGARPQLLGQVPAGVTRLAVQGLNTSAGYCVHVAAMYSAAEIGTSDPQCLTPTSTRGSAGPAT